MANTALIVGKLVELSEHAVVFSACFLFIAAIGLALACLLCWLEDRLHKSHHMHLVFRALHATSFVLLIGDCGLLLAWCGYAVATTAGLA